MKHSTCMSISVLACLWWTWYVHALTVVMSIGRKGLRTKEIDDVKMLLNAKTHCLALCIIGT